MLAVRVPCSRARAADDEQADAEDEDDELKSDAYGVLEAALQTLVADGELWRGRAGRRPPGARRASRPWLPRTETMPRAGRMNQQGADRAGETLNSSPGVVVGALELLVRAVPRCPDVLDGRSHGPPFGLDRGRPGEGAEAAQRHLPVDDVGRVKPHHGSASGPEVSVRVDVPATDQRCGDDRTTVAIVYCGPAVNGSVIETLASADSRYSQSSILTSSPGQRQPVQARQRTFNPRVRVRSPGGPQAF